MAEISTRDYQIINYIGIAVASASILAVCLLFAFLGIVALRKPSALKLNFAAYPTRALYIATGISIPYSVGWIVSSTSAASNNKLCETCMIAIILGAHLINSVLLLILLHCTFLLTTFNATTAKIATRGIAFIEVTFAIVITFTGLRLNRYGYVEDQATCWMIYPGSEKDLFRIEVLILYGPLFITSGVQVLLFLFIVYKLRSIRLRPRGFRKMILRLGFTPLFLALHCLLIIGGDAPIDSRTKAAKFTSAMMSYVGFASTGLFLAVCAVFVDPAVRTTLKALRKVEVEEELVVVEHTECKSHEHSKIMNVNKESI